MVQRACPAGPVLRHPRGRGGCRGHERRGAVAWLSLDGVVAGGLACAAAACTALHPMPAGRRLMPVCSRVPAAAAAAAAAGRCSRLRRCSSAGTSSRRGRSTRSSGNSGASAAAGAAGARRPQLRRHRARALPAGAQHGQLSPTRRLPAARGGRRKRMEPNVGHAWDLGVGPVLPALAAPRPRREQGCGHRVVGPGRDLPRR